MFLFTIICLCLFALYGVLIDYYRRAWNAIPYSFVPGTAGVHESTGASVPAVASESVRTSESAGVPETARASELAGTSESAETTESVRSSQTTEVPESVRASKTVEASESTGASESPGAPEFARALGFAETSGFAATPESAGASESAKVSAFAVASESAGTPESPSPSLKGMRAATFRTRISVLVPARNEENNIGACLQSLSRQSYPKDAYEVIVIDDHSTDRTAALVKEFMAGGMALRCLRLSEVETVAGRVPGSAKTGAAPSKAYKKFAIETGIHAAAGELIITTDADCQFHSDWLRTLAGFYEETGAKFIAAPVRIGEPAEAGSKRAKGGHSFLVLFQTLDFITLQGITGAAVYKRFHSMCNGANLAYEKKTFYEVQGFKDIDDIPSGDDMLLMHKIYKKYPSQVFFVKSPQAIVSTRPETNWKGFVNQRVRWASKADKYEDKRIFWVLLLVYLLNLLFIGLLLASWWNSWYLWLLLILLTIKTMVEFPFVRSVAVFFGQGHLMIYFPALQPFHIIYTVVIGWLGKFGSYRWKERTIIK